MQCPNCRGTGRLYPAIPHKGFPACGIACDICSGAGILPEDVEYIPEEGKLLKGSRYRSGRTLKAESERLGMDVSELSKRERGYFGKSEHIAFPI
jgi:hypothetical protein